MQPDSITGPPDAIWAWDVTDPTKIDRYSLERVFTSANSIDTLLIGTGTGVWLPPPELQCSVVYSAPVAPRRQPRQSRSR